MDPVWCRLTRLSLACTEIPLKLRSWKLVVGSLILPLMISESEASLIQGQICQVIFWLFPCLFWWEASFPLICWRICQASSLLTGAWYIFSLRNTVYDGARKTAHSMQPFFSCPELSQILILKNYAFFFPYIKRESQDFAHFYKPHIEKIPVCELSNSQQHSRPVSTDSDTNSGKALVNFDFSALSSVLLS